MPIKNYSTTAGNNTLSPPNGAPIGTTKVSQLDDIQRQVMADVREWYNTPEWRDLGHTPTFVSSSSFTIPTDVTASYRTGQRIRISDSSTLYGTIASATFGSPNTTISVTLDSGSITSSISAVSVGVNPDNKPINGTAINNLIGGVADNTLAPAKVAFTATDKLLGRSTSGAGAGEEITCTSFARTLLDDADAATARTTLGVGAASDTAAGIVELATAAEMQAGTDTARVPSVAVVQANKMVYATTVASTSGTSIDFTSIPSWARRVSVFLNQVSKSGTSAVIIRIGTGGSPATTGYETGAVDFNGSAQGGAASTTGFLLNASISATTTYSGMFNIEKSTSNTNAWVCSGTWNGAATGQIGVTSGNITLGGVLDMVRVTMENGTDTFDAGSITVRWE